MKDSPYHLKLLLCILVFLSPRQVYSTSLIIDFVTEGFLWPKMVQDVENHKAHNKTDYLNLTFLGSDFNYLTAEGERAMFISGANVAKQNSKHLEQIKAWKEIEVYAHSTRSSVISSMQSYILG